MFHAFISYNHRADERLAPILQRAIERLGTPWWRPSPVRVFRDDATLVASAALWPAIEAGLERAQHLVLLASPAAASSPWVDREVGWWLARRPLANLLIAVTGGDITYDPSQRDFDWSRTTCLPPSLRGAFDTEPHWVDLRFAAAQPELLSLRDSRLRSAALSLAAAVRGIEKDQLESDDLRTHRRSVAMAAVAGVALGVLAISTTWALRSAGEQREVARANRMQAESRRLASESLSDLARGAPGLEPAIYKAALAWRLAPTEEARAALNRIDADSAGIARVLGTHTRGAYKIALSPDGRVLATVGHEGAVLRWSLATGLTVGTAFVTRGQPRALRFSADGSHLMVLGSVREKEAVQPALALFELADGSLRQLNDAGLNALRKALPEGRFARPCAATSASGTRVAVAEASVVVVQRVVDGTLSTTRLPESWRVGAMGFAGEDSIVILAESIYSGGGLRAGRIELAGAAQPRLVLGPLRAGDGTQCDFANFSADGRRVVIADRGVWQIDDALALKPQPLPPRALTAPERYGHHAPELDATGRLVAVGINGTGRVWDLDRREPIVTTPKDKGGHGPALALSGDGSRFAALLDGVPVVWTVGRDAPVKMSEPDCSQREGLVDRCIARLCERLTGELDDARWREMLGSDFRSLLDAAKASACTGVKH